MTRLTAVFFAGLIVAACRGGSAAPPATSTPPPGASATSAAETPSPSPTPDPFASVVTDPAAAVKVLERAIPATASDPCPAALKSGWDATCATGDVDGDGKPDHAYLVRIAQQDSRNPTPGAVLVRRAATGKFETFPVDGDADRGDLGRAIFGISERTGDIAAELVFLTTSCGASNCASTVRVEHWDGSAWRDAGPANAIDNLERAEWQGEKGLSRLVVRGGRLGTVGAGPTRSVTITYSYTNSRYTILKTEPDPAVYLYHAILDADALFLGGKFEQASAAYAAAIANKDLKDWKAEAGRAPGQPALAGYALFRIAVSAAARNEDANAELDDVIRLSKDQLFVNAAEAFRRGFQERQTVHGACLAVTDYLATQGIPDYVREMFDYGYANPPRTYRDICPL
ncbi:MAG: hypothetical protein HY875_16015 [Chloroflexi bacterium]|nr:hypothetical protein [Chloroflexota bacterium]